VLARLEAVAVVQLRPSLFWVVTQLSNPEERSYNVFD
jgi:hypothetical protein